MTNRKNRHPAFCFLGSARGSRAGFGGSPKPPSNPQRQIAFDRTRPHLFLNPGNMPSRKLPMTVALDHCVRELHGSIEWFAVRCSFHARFPENNCRVIAVKPR
jgi:hypothetical protein